MSLHERVKDCAPLVATSEIGAASLHERPSPWSCAAVSEIESESVAERMKLCADLKAESLDNATSEQVLVNPCEPLEATSDDNAASEHVRVNAWLERVAESDENAVSEQVRISP